MAIKKTNSGWLVDAQPGGRGQKRYRKTLATKAEALQYEAWLTTQVASAPDWVPKRKDSRRLDELIQAWYDLHGVQLRSGANTRSRLLLLSASLGNPIASDLTAEAFATYRSRRLSATSTADGKRKLAGVTASNLNRELAYLRAMFNELKRVGVWKGENPFSTLRQFKVQERELSFLTADQIQNLLTRLSVSDGSDALLVAKVCLSTGARWSEAEELRRSQIRNSQIHFSQTKSGKNRSVPISSSLESELIAHGDGAPGRLFQDSYGAFRWAIAKAGIELPRGQLSHVLRHTFASHFMMNGGNILTLQRILGHASLTMTMRYAHLSPGHLIEAIELNPLVRIQEDGES